MKQLYLSDKNKVIAGVCGGAGEYFNIDPVIVRLVWMFLVFCWLSGLWLYLVAWIIIPKKSNNN